MEDRMIRQIAEKNLAMLFASTEFEVKIDHPIEGNEKIHLIIIAPTGPNPSTSMAAKMEINELSKRNKKISIGTSFYTESVNDEFTDLVTCAKAIERRIDMLSWVKHIYFETDEFIVVGFTEIGIEFPDGSRDLLVSRGKIYSHMKFKKDGSADTKPISEKKVTEILQKAIDDGCDVDFCGSDVIYFVDTTEYVGDEE